MVFLRSPRDLLALEEAREQRLHVVAQMLQGGLRRFVARKRLAQLKPESQKLFNGQKRRRGSVPLTRLGRPTDRFGCLASLP